MSSGIDIANKIDKDCAKQANDTAVSESELNDLLSAAIDLYTPPFTYQRGYIFDAHSHMVADEAARHITQVRGWGRISYMEGAEELQDMVGELIAKALTEYWGKHKGR